MDNWELESGINKNHVGGNTGDWRTCTGIGLGPFDY
eukprot:SAG31_NODE_12544_length_934_cov_0.688623_1_plen_36_part_00